MLLSINKLNFSYGDLNILWDIDLELHEGEIVTVVGANGAGKSTTLNCISRLIEPTSGTICYNGEELTGLESHHVVERGIIQVPEGRKIFPEMTVMENLRMGSYIRTARKDRESNLEQVFNLFPRLKERSEQLGGTMSGGEQQMLAIGRGLMANPKIMMLDEPSLGLSPLFVGIIFEIIQEINRKGVTILLVEQNVYNSLKIADRAYVLDNGRIVLSGTGNELLVNDYVKKAFLGI